ncbi:MAG: hypothetical protein ACI85O_001131 [Saprospiraceae bacterium]|jgi:uncharacterized protein (DUF2141 family)
MKTFLKTLLVAAAFSSLSFSNSNVSGKMIIEFPNINPNEGMVEVSVYDDSEAFLVKDQFIQKKRAQIVNGKAQLIFENIPFGKIAVGSYHDVDADETYDKNFIGLPIEPYAFSKKPTCNWRKPRFEEVSFDFTENGQVLQMEFQVFME